MDENNPVTEPVSHQPSEEPTPKALLKALTGAAQVLLSSTAPKSKVSKAELHDQANRIGYLVTQLVIASM